MPLPRSLVWIVSFAMTILGIAGASAQGYPNRPLRLVTTGIGGGSDMVARLVAQGITSSLGQQLIVDNRSGSGFAVGELVAKAPADGYTLLVFGQALWIGPLMQAAPYDALKDFAPITMTDRSPSVVSMHPSLPVKSVKELIALAKAKPKQLNYGSTAAGSAGHLAGELFKSMAGVDIVWVPYKSMAIAVTDLISDQVQLMFTSPSPVAPHITSGKLRALAVGTLQPSPLLPGLPTVAATGLPGYEATSITAFLAPAGTPAAIINRLNQEIVRYVKTPDAKEKLFNTGAEAVGSSPQELTSDIKADIVKYGKVIKDAGIKIN